MIISDIDFAAMYMRHMRLSDRPPKPASDWDARARKLGAQDSDNGYAQEFVRRMDLGDARTLLDVGCGAGTIALRVAAQLEQVIGLDYSAGMLERMRERAAAQNLNNVRTCLRAWDDDWSDVPQCDIVVASRSSMVPDMAYILEKMTNHARCRCYMTHLADGHFGDAAIAELLGRKKRAFPDYIYIVNLLHRMGIHPRLDYIVLPGRLAGTDNVDEFIKKVTWTFGDLSDDETQRLRDWYLQDPVRAREGGGPVRWAFIAWDVPA